MEALSLLKFWKSNTAKVAAGTTTGDADETITVADSTFSDPLYSDTDDDDDDSFFELELTLPNHGSKFSKSEPKETEFEPRISSKPQSPISILRSVASPKLRVFMFGKRNRKPKLQHDSTFDTDSVSISSPKRSGSNLLSVKFMIEDGSFVPRFTRSNSSGIANRIDEVSEPSKRFSKDVAMKYLNILKPRKSGESEKLFAATSPARSTASFPSPRKEKDEKQSSRFKSVKLKNLGKSKSSSAMIVSPSPASFPARNDHPCDGIEGAILHCKRSLHSSKGSSLSRCSSDPSYEKSIQVSEKI